MSQHFAHLHLHTEYSLLDGAIRINELIALAKEQNWQAVAMTDHGNIFGAVRFVQECNKAGIKPVLGCEMYLTPDAAVKDPKEKYYHLIVLVQNETGYKNLCQLMAFAYKEGFYFKPRIDYAMLQKHSEGLIVTTACLGGHITSLLRHGKPEEARERARWFLDVFGRDRFYIEVQPPEYEKQVEANRLLFELADELDIQCIATSDAHYLRTNDREAHEVLLSVQTRALLSDPKRFTFGEFRGHLRTTQEMLELFPDRPEVVWNTGKVADMCDFSFEEGKLYFPTYPIPKEHTQESFFKHQCVQGLKALKARGQIPADQYKIYDERLEEETSLIITMGFIGYFLVVGDFIDWAKKQSISVGPGRGSAAGSLVAWALGITGVDPIKYNLLFERFLNPERVTMPDIDIDFCIERREEVIEYVRQKYGHDCVCQIITFGTMMAKGVIKDVARSLGFPFSDANAITDLIPDQLKISIDEAIEQEPQLKAMIEGNPEVQKLIAISKKLEGLTRHASKHAAGVVISPQPLAQMLPLYIPSKTTDLVAQYAMTELESIGFLKMDFLGLKNLTLIDNALRSIEQNHGVQINLEQLPFDDAKAFELLCKGTTDGVFQLESDGLKDVLRKLQPSRFEDIIAVNALYRPGPLGSGMVDEFIDRRHGRKKTTYMFAELEPILAETYGVIVYQEQVMKIASSIAGYSLGAADILRRAMGKKKAEVMEQQAEMFVAGAAQKGFDKKKAKELFDLMAYFAGYGFNKSHSTAYALIAYQTAYLKANYPHEFMAALVTFETSNPDKLTQYLQAINDMHIPVQPPDVNRSEIAFSTDGKEILFGLQGIKNVGHTALENILAERAKKPFIDLLDFCLRVDLRTVNKRVVENLIGTGALDKLPGNRAQKLAELEQVMSLAVDKKEALRTGQTSLFGMPASANSGPEMYAFAPLKDFSDKEKLEKEKELAGFYLSSHPLKQYGPALKWFFHESFATHLEKLEKHTGAREPEAVACGLMQTHKVITTKKGDKMAFAQLEDFSGHCEVIIFPKTYAKVSQWLDSYNVFLITGSVDMASRGKCKIKAESMIPVELLLSEKDVVSQLQLQLPAGLDQELLKKIQAQLTPGNIRLSIRFEENGKLLGIAPKQKVCATIDGLRKLAKLGVEISCVM